MIKGQLLSGDSSSLLIRQQSTVPLVLGELLAIDLDGSTMLLQVTELLHSSQLSQQNLELISGMHLEQQTSFEFIDSHLRNYALARLKPLLCVEGKKSYALKSLPPFFAHVRSVSTTDFAFLHTPQDPLYLGQVRSGMTVLDVPVFLDARAALSHHILIAAMTGKGKSNLCKVLLWHSAQDQNTALLVFDPHDEYYGRHMVGLKDHPSKQVVYYTAQTVPPGGRTLCLHLSLIKPYHLAGAIDLSDAQQDVTAAYYREYNTRWINALLLDEPVSVQFHESSVAVVKRKLFRLLDLSMADGQLRSHGVFSVTSGTQFVQTVLTELDSGKIVIVDSSMFSGSTEILLGSILNTSLFYRYKQHKMNGLLLQKPTVAIVLEEAPRVLGKEVLEKGPNIFSTIAREGRKFSIGLLAITQLPSLIPRQILANMNTKIILGVEMKAERQALIESASQDLSFDDRAIASLDKGEAIITSSFLPLALPITIPLFAQHVKQFLSKRSTSNVAQAYQGLNIV